MDQLEDLAVNLPNVVGLTDPQWTLGSLILMVSYGAHFAFIIYFIMASFQMAPRYRVVAILSAVVMASAGLSLLREWSMWSETYEFVRAAGMWVPAADGQTFSNAYRYGNWTITVPLLLVQLPIAFGLMRKDLHTRAVRMAIPALLMIWTGLIGQFGEVNDFSQLNLWGVISSIFFAWLVFEVWGVIKAGTETTPTELRAWPKNLFWYFLATWGLYPIAYALPQLGQDGWVVVSQQLVFSIADISTKLIYGVMLSRFCLRRSAIEGYEPAAFALDTTGETSKIAARVE
ncbi:MAG: bacteriorhodopsin [Pacificimonas sp.]